MDMARLIQSSTERPKKNIWSQPYVEARSDTNWVIGPSMVKSWREDGASSSSMGWSGGQLGFGSRFGLVFWALCRRDRCTLLDRVGRIGLGITNAGSIYQQCDKHKQREEKCNPSHSFVPREVILVPSISGVCSIPSISPNFTLPFDF